VYTLDPCYLGALLPLYLSVLASWCLTALVPYHLRVLGSWGLVALVPWYLSALFCLMDLVSRCLSALRHVQTGNVSRANIIKHCLIKHRSNYGNKPLSRRGTHGHTKHVWYGSPNKENIAHGTREQNKCLSCLTECLMAFKCYHCQTAPNDDQTAKYLVTKQCLTVFGHQTFPIWTGLLCWGAVVLWCHGAFSAFVACCLSGQQPLKPSHANSTLCAH